MTTPESPNSRLYAAWFENIAVAEDHPDRVYFIVEATERHAQMSAHHEVEESGPEVGLPAKRVMTSPVQAYVREDVAEAAVEAARLVEAPSGPREPFADATVEAAYQAGRLHAVSSDVLFESVIAEGRKQADRAIAAENETTALRRERDAAVEHAAAFAEVSRIVGISYEADGRPVVPGPTDVVLAEVSEILVAANQSRELKSERDAVRRERDALAAEAEGLRKHIAAMVDLYERATANDTDEMPADDWAVYQAARAEMPAGKGVG